MNNLDLFRMGFKNLWRRKLRTFLTVLGVVIGVTSIIVMLSLGFGMTKFSEEQISQWGSLTTITVHKGWNENNKDNKLDDKAVEAFQALPNVEAVGPILESYGTIINGKYIASVPIKGVDPSNMEAFGFDIGEGRLLENGDSMTMVFGSSMKYNFYNPKSRGGVYKEPNIDLMKDRMKLTMNQNYGWDSGDGNKVNYKEYKIRSVGVLAEGNWETSYGVYMPISDVKTLIREKEKAENVKPANQSDLSYTQISVKVNGVDNVQTVQQTIKDMGYEAYSLNDQLEYTKKQTAVIQAVLGGIGAVSLLVAAIGITNTMVMSIYERTKEIGVMKVIGASIKDIKRLFLLESALIGITGGILGISFSYLVSFIVNKFSHIFGEALGLYGATQISIIPTWLALSSMGFAALIGVVSGYFPARRAMNLSALEAIKTE